MKELSATQAAVLADDVYALTKLADLKRAMKYLNDTYGEVFEFSEDQLLKAKTGGPGFIKTRTAFGFVLLGKGRYSGQAFILFRGTQYLADWLTNLNVGVSRTASGQPVHDGFNKTFKSMLRDLNTFMANAVKKGIHTIHCIGHSLGGALATICGEWISSSYSKASYVYTFGSPRVGLYDFSHSCTSKLSSKRIFRAYHKTDIVPCIPPWPFVHTPNTGVDYFLPSPGSVPAAEYHDMAHYIESVDDKAWSVLAALKKNCNNNQSIAAWLKGSSPVMNFTISTIEMLSDALIYVLKKCTDGLGQVISRAVGTSYTLLDQLSYILKKGIDISESVSGWVVCLIRKIMQFLGMSKELEAADITAVFIRNIFVMLQQKISVFTKSVLSQSLAKGRAI